MKKVIIVLILLFVPINVSALGESSKSAIIMNTDNNQVIYEKNAHEPRLIASTTKIMTAVLAIELGNLDEIVTAGEEVLTMYGTSIYIQLNEQMTLRDLIYGLMLRSGNDAAVVIANHIGGTEEKFVTLMNDLAKEIGMTNTTFANPHGLDEETQNYSTAYDLALLSSYANGLEEYKIISGTIKHEVQTIDKSYLWYNRNELLETYEYATGGKTGYTPSAGRTLVTTASKDNSNLTVVTLDDNDMYNNQIELYEYAFNNFTYYKVIDKDTFYLNETLYENKLYINEDFSYMLNNEDEKDIKTTLKISKLENYNNNDKVGEVEITLNGKELKKIDVYVEITKDTWWDKFIDFIIFWN